MVGHGHGESCFFCLKPIHAAKVQWDEQNNWQQNPQGDGLIKIHLHPKCAAMLGERLIGDAKQAAPDEINNEAVQQLVRSRLGCLLIEAQKEDEIILSESQKRVMRAFRRHGTASRADMRRETKNYHASLQVLIKLGLVEEPNRMAKPPKDSLFSLTKKGGTFMPSVLDDNVPGGPC